MPPNDMLALNTLPAVEWPQPGAATFASAKVRGFVTARTADLLSDDVGLRRELAQLLAGLLSTGSSAVVVRGSLRGESRPGRLRNRYWAVLAEYSNADNLSAYLIGDPRHLSTIEVSQTRPGDVVPSGDGWGPDGRPVTMHVGPVKDLTLRAKPIDALDAIGDTTGSLQHLYAGAAADQRTAADAVQHATEWLSAKRDAFCPIGATVIGVSFRDRRDIAAHPRVQSAEGQVQMSEVRAFTRTAETTFEERSVVVAVPSPRVHDEIAWARQLNAYFTARPFLHRCDDQSVEGAVRVHHASPDPFPSITAST